MAEKVEIRGGELDGSLLQNAASEATLLRLVEAFEKKNGTGTGNRVQDTYNRSIKEATKQSTSLGESFENTRRSVNSFSSGMMGFVTKGLGTIISGATFAVRSFTDFLSSSFKNYRDIADTGVTFGNNMVEVSRVALTAGMGLREFTDMVKRNGQVFMGLAGTAGQGAKRFAELRDQIINSDLGTRFFGLGMVTQDMENYLGGYLEQQQRLGNVERRSNAEITRGLSAYVEELDKVSKLTGIERKQLEARARRIDIDPVFAALRRALNPEQLARSTANLAMAAEIGGSDFENAIKEISTGVIQSDLAKELVSTGALTREAALAISQGTGDAATIMQRSFAVMERSGRYANATLLQGNQQLAAGARTMDNLRRVAAANTDQARRESEARNSLTEAFGKIPAVFNSIRNKIFGAIIESRTFDRLIQVFNSFAGGLNTYVDPIVAYFKQLFENMAQIGESEGVIGALRYGFQILFRDARGVVFPELRKLLNDLFGTTDIVADVKNLIKEGFQSLIRIALEGIGSAISGMIRGNRGNAQPAAGEYGPPASAAGGNASGSTSALSDILSVMSSLGTVLGIGAAAGVGLIFAVGAFGRALNAAAPGAAALGLAIGMSGAGLGLAFWGLGQAIDAVGNSFTKVGDFIQKMGEQDAGNLRDVGTALGPLSSSLVTMGGAGVLALISGGGLANLASALEKIGTLDPGRITNVAPALTTLHEALSLYTGGQGGGILASLGGAISRFFAGDNGIGRFADAFVKFNNIDGNNIRNVASGLQEIRSSIGQEFTEQARAIDTYAGRIENLTIKVDALNTALARLRSQGGRTFTLDQLATAAGGGTATNALVEEQRKLNTLIEGLKPVFEETRDNTKETADSVSGRRALTGR